MDRWQCKASLTSRAALATVSVSSELSMDPTVHNRVKELRQAHDWTQEHLAALAGVSRQSINSIERDRYVPSLALALLLARVFRCPVERIFSLAAAPQPEPHLPETTV